MKLSELIEKHGSKEVDEQAVINMLGIKTSDKLKDGDTYWLVDCDGDISSSTWLNMPGDNYRYFQGNCFATEEEAEKYGRVLRTWGELRQYAKEHNECEIDWDDAEQEKYFLELDTYDARRCMDINYKFKQAREVYFTSEKILNAAIEEIGKEAIMEYLKYEW